MTFTYTRASLIAGINRGVHNKLGMFSDINETCNDAVRKVYGDIDIRTSRRKTALTPGLFNKEYEYACPSDLKTFSIIDIVQQAGRSDGSFNLVPTEEFTVNKKNGDVAIDDFNGTRLILINSQFDDQTYQISELDSITSGGGTWVVSGDAADLTQDTDDYFRGAASLKFNIGTGGATAGIVNSTLNQFDITDYLNGSSAVFVRAKINSTTKLTSYTLKIGSDASNYYSKTITTKNDGTAFTNGWNILRFDLASLTQTGTPVNTACNYVSLVMNKETDKASDTNYKFDEIVIKRGKNSDIKYYSKFGWQNTAGAYLENSTSSSDYLVADADEFRLVTLAGISIGKRELNYPQADINDADNEYTDAVKMYMLKNPSEAKVMSYSYYNYE